MKKLLHLRYYLFAISPLLLLLARAGLAQCPTASRACTPGAAPAPAYAFGMGILNVTLGTINNTTPGAPDGYRDYACTLGTTLTVGQDYPLQVRTNAAVDENVRAWLDLNNDGTFDPAGELIFSATGRNAQTGTVRVAGNATTGVPLRLRVAADYVFSPLPTPCSTPQYSQVEDYRVTLQPNAQLPAAGFVADQTTTCTGCVQFTDQSTNGPTTWAWNFGDNTTSTQQNPRHCYAATGTYTVTLTVRNAAGESTRTRTDYVTYDSRVPAAASCSPQTLQYCCGYGITQVQLGTLTSNSANGQAGYQNFTCSGRVTLTEGNRYPISITTGINNQDTRVWLDGNNDGQFTADELLLEALNRTSPVTGSLLIPVSAQKNVPLRLRIMSDYVGAEFAACSSLQFGQAEDYTVTVAPNTQPPVADFTSDYAGACSRTVQFADLSQNAPTSWRWDFGDGATSTQQNPRHTYTTSGFYDVSLAVSNAFGTQTATKRGYLAVAVPCPTYCTPTSAGSPVIWITNVSVSGSALPTPFSNASAAEPGGYGNYTRSVLLLRSGTSYGINVATSNTLTRQTSVWIDYNRNGAFETAELVANGVTSTIFAGTFTVPNQTAALGFTRMRVMTRLNVNSPNACLQNQANQEAEDYSVHISNVTAAANARALAGVEAYPNPTADGHLRLRLPGATAGSYSVQVENLLGATVQHTNVRFVNGADASLDLNTLPQGVYLLRITAPNGLRAIRRLVRQ